jgi:serine/threonine protein kinase/tetratricopeptide (TPR) repeat protein
MSEDHDSSTERDGEAQPLEPTIRDVLHHCTQVTGEGRSHATAKMICPRCRHVFSWQESVCPDDGVRLLVFDHEDGSRVGEVIQDRLTLLGLLGTGGMGTVYRALQHSMGREVAVKLLRRYLSSDEALVERFMREARSASRLAHPNIITVFDFGKTDEEELFLVMELLRGRSIRQIIEAEGPLPIDRVLALVEQVCDALHAAHEMGVIHCDIKPDNVFVLTGAGQHGEFVKVIDFGLAKVLRPDGTISDKDLKVDGTPAYMAPEQIMAQGVDRRTDIYALGVLTYEMLAATLPFNTSQAARMMLAHVLEDPRPLREARLDPARPEAIDRVVMSALAKSPSDRPATARDFRRMLRQAWGLLLGQAHPSRPRVSPLPPCRDNNLPGDGSSFVGREADLSALEALLRDGKRLITILGPGGMGKTRLSLRFAATRIRDSEIQAWKSTWFCDLSEARDLDGVCRVVAEVLDVPLLVGQTAEESVDQLSVAISARGRTLIILDNFEPVAHLASQSVGVWLRTPQVRFIVTSRETLHLGQEVVYDLPPLSVPDKETETLSEAESLFFERAMVARPGWQPTAEDRRAVAEIVRQLDGIPLAIELAAARLRILSAVNLLQRLEKQLDILASNDGTRPDRQATLRAAIAWSWDMLKPWEQQAMAQLAVFIGGFTLEAAEAVVSLEPSDETRWVGDVLQSLKEKSLIFSTEPKAARGDLRFGLYDTIRRFADEKLEASGNVASTSRRHGDYYLATCEAWSDQANGPNGIEMRDLLLMERENLLAVHQRALETTPADGTLAAMALRAILCLDPLLSTRGPFGEHVQLLDHALRAVETSDVPADLVARALQARGEARRTRGLLAEATADFERALDLARSVDAKRIEGRLLYCVGVVADSQGEIERSGNLLRHALRVQREVGDRRWEGRTVGVLGVIAFWQARHEEARLNIERALQMLHDAGDRQYEGYFLGVLGAVHQETGALNEARLQYERALEILREVGGRRHEGMFLGYLGGLEWEQGRFAEARRRLGQALGIAREVGDRRHIGLFLAMRSGLDASDDHLKTAAEGFAEAAVVLREVGDLSIQSAVELHRGHLDLALARRAMVVGPSEEVSVHHDSAASRIARAEHGEAEAGPQSRRSDDVRFALRMLKRAVDWQPKGLARPG